MNYRSMAFLICFISSLPCTVCAGTWHIFNDGSGDAPTIQAGIDSAALGDTVFVGPGSYPENIDFLGKDILVKSESGPELTIIDGSTFPEAVVRFTNGETRKAILQGFMFTGGTGHIIGSVARGAGVYCEMCSPSILNNTIRGNSTVDSMGGGIFVGIGYGPVLPPEQVSPLIEGNLIEGNSAVLGGGIAITWGNAVIRNNVTKQNTAQTDGAGIFAWLSQGSPLIEHNQFWENAAGDHGGGVYAANTNGATDVQINYNLFIRNSAYGADLGDTGSGGALYIFDFSGTLANNTIVDNLGRGESDCSGGGIALDNTPSTLEITRNIIALNDGCGLSCRDGADGTLGPNIFWQNLQGDLGCLSGNAILIADPQFCNPNIDNYSVAITSPAFGPGGPMGVWTDPGCGPGVRVRPATWGKIKALYASDRFVRSTH